MKPLPLVSVVSPLESDCYIPFRLVPLFPLRVLMPELIIMENLVENFVKSVTIMLVLLNPFLMSIYMMDLIQKLELPTFCQVLIRGAIISAIVFVAFAWVGDAIFTDILQVRFASFLIFGGIVFLFIGLRFVFGGSEALQELRGQPKDLAVAVAMPFTIGPGTVGASVLAGSRLPHLWASLAILLALSIAVSSIVLLKMLHDYVKERNEALVERYIDIVGRVTALIVGTFAIEMILQGIEIWLGNQQLF